jgi:small basic protein
MLPVMALLIGIFIELICHACVFHYQNNTAE